MIIQSTFTRVGRSSFEIKHHIRKNNLPNPSHKREIVADDKRAAGVIRRLRTMLKKGELEQLRCCRGVANGCSRERGDRALQAAGIDA